MTTTISMVVAGWLTLMVAGYFVIRYARADAESDAELEGAKKGETAQEAEDEAVREARGGMLTRAGRRRDRLRRNR